MSGGRAAALRAAVVVAAGFVALRVGYRVVFGGGAGGGALLVDLPRIPLDGPFSHVVLLGPITTGGLASAVRGALPFALLVLALGVVGAIVDFRRLLVRGAARGPLRAVCRILVVAWGTFPALLASVRRVRVARELRGERSAASLVVPVLEQTVERAIALGASMEVRGFAAEGSVEFDRERPAVLRVAELGYPDRPLLADLDLEVRPGTLTLVTGPTGCGKSTLLRGLSGLLQHVDGGSQGGTVEVGGADRAAVPPRETAHLVGFVGQSVRLSFVAALAGEEIGFVLAQRGTAAAEVEARVAAVAGRLGIEHLLSREVVDLSAGEACLVAIAAAVAGDPALLLVDEPLAELDSAARRRVVRLLDEIAHQGGVAVVVAEHASAEFAAVADRVLRLGPDAEAVPGIASATPPSSPPREPRVVARVRGVTVRHGSRTVLEDVSLDLAAGELVALTGANGAGKSTLLSAFARPTTAGVVEVGGRDVHVLGRRARRQAIALVPEASDDLVFATTVAQECHRPDRRLRDGGATTRERFLALLGADAGRAGELMDVHPRDLSAGERLCLVIAIQLAARPAVLLVDEPSRGLDGAARRLVGEALVVAALDGCAVLFATHDREFAAGCATRSLRLDEGRLLTVAGVAR